MSPQLAASLLIWPLLGRIDRGEREAINAVAERVDNGTLFSWLRSEHDINVGEEAEAVLLDAFRNLHEYVDAGRKFGVRTSGLALLLAWCVELYQQALTP